jgi:hypothetical protein
MGLLGSPVWERLSIATGALRNVSADSAIAIQGEHYLRRIVRCVTSWRALSVPDPSKGDVNRARGRSARDAHRNSSTAKPSHHRSGTNVERSAADRPWSRGARERSLDSLSELLSFDAYLEPNVVLLDFFMGF